MPIAPTLPEVKAYLGENSSYSDAEVTSALAAETQAQANGVKFPADPQPPQQPLPYPADLAEALKRRVQRNLAMKALPLGYQQSSSEFGQINTRIGADPEIRRLEGPYRKRVVG